MNEISKNFRSRVKLIIAGNVKTKINRNDNNSNKNVANEALMSVMNVRCASNYSGNSKTNINCRRNIFFVCIIPFVHLFCVFFSVSVYRSYFYQIQMEKH